MMIFIFVIVLEHFDHQLKVSFQMYRILKVYFYWFNNEGNNEKNEMLDASCYDYLLPRII